MTRLDDVPDEIIRHILYYVPPDDTLAHIQLLSRRFHNICSEPLLWRYHCRTSFRYWRDEHGFREKLAGRALDVDWKGLWILRRNRNVRIAHLLDGILASKVGRLKKFEQICQLGYDAKDFLLEQCYTDDSADDVLARRYYGSTALDSIHRSIAVDVWSQYQGAPLSSRGLERALGAFDMFVLHDQPQDLDYITRSLDALAKQFREAQPGVEAMPTRQKALSLVRWLRSHKLTGMDDPATNYRNLRNCFIGHALSDPDHPSLPIISSAIFCAVAERLGITSSCCSFPGHVHASVFAPPGQTLDGDDTEPGGELEVMFLDPYGSDSEVEDLRSRLAETGLPNTSDVFLSASPVPVIVQRTAQNIRTTFRWAQELPDDDPAAVRLKQLRAGHPDLNLEAAFYGAMWSQLLMRQTNSIQWDIHLNAFLNRFALTWSEDAWIVEKYLVPLYDAFMAAQPLPRHRVGWENVREILDMLHNLDRRQPTVNRRYTREIEEHVHYRIGQVFRHRRYGYIGVINGWAAGPMALPTPHYLSGDDAEEEGLGEDVASSQQLPPRRSTTYYTCLRPSVDRLRVAQENIEIVTDPSLIPESLFFLAGKFFKRFDRETCRFVSNIKEMYPDD